MNISRIDNIIEKHRNFLQNYFSKNDFSFGFSARSEDLYFYVSVVIEEAYGGSCWDETVFHREHKFKKFKVINSLRFFLSTILPKEKKSTLQKIAQSIYNDTTPNKHFNDGYYGNYSRTLCFNFPVHLIFEHIYLFRKSNKIYS